MPRPPSPPALVTAAAKAGVLALPIGACRMGHFRLRLAVKAFVGHICVSFPIRLLSSRRHPVRGPSGASEQRRYPGKNRNHLELILRAVDVPEPLQRIRTQGETEAWPVGRVHHAVRTDVERLVEELPHHRHPALAHLENVA